MVVRSGVVLDFDTLVGVSGAEVYSLTVTGTYFYDIVTASGDGTFNINVDNTQDVIYLPFKNGYKGQSKQVSSSVSGVTLYLTTSSGLPASGSVFTNLIGAPLITSTGVIDILCTPCSLFAITEEGLDVIDNNTFENLAYALYSGGFKALHANHKICDGIDLYLGTASSGVTRIIYNYSVGNVGDISISGVTVVNSSSIFGNNITCIHSNSSRELVVATNSGITFISEDFGPSYHHQTISGVTSCYITEEGDVYYSPTNSGIYVKYAPISANWTTPDYFLNLSTTPSISGLTINDININPVLSGGNNQIFLATNSGIGVYDEERSAISGSELKWFYAGVSGALLSGVARNFTGIEIEENSSISGGTLLLSSFLDNYEAIEDLQSYGLEDFSPVQLFDIASNDVVYIYRNIGVETNLRRLGIAFLGSRFLSKC